jgi:hypothetical protein
MRHEQCRKRIKRAQKVDVFAAVYNDSGLIDLDHRDVALANHKVRHWFSAMALGHSHLMINHKVAHIFVQRGLHLCG